MCSLLINHEILNQHYSIEIKLFTYLPENLGSAFLCTSDLDYLVWCYAFHQQILMSKIISIKSYLSKSRGITQRPLRTLSIKLSNIIQIKLIVRQRKYRIFNILSAGVINEMNRKMKISVHGQEIIKIISCP